MNSHPPTPRSPEPQDNQLIVSPQDASNAANGVGTAVAVAASSEAAGSVARGGARPFAGYWSGILILALLAGGLAAGRILSCQQEINRTDMPFFSANDRSRWCTVRALVDHGTYEIDEVLAAPDGANWNTIDKVRHVGRDGTFHYYSSKPTLLPTMMAGGYWVLKQGGWSISEHPFWVIRTLLLVVNGLGMMLAVGLMGILGRQLARDPRGALFAVAAGSLGTFALTFSNTFNNHLPAAFAVLLALTCLIPVWRQRIRGGKWRSLRAAVLYAVVGGGSAFAAACDLPALSFTAVCFGMCLLRSPSLSCWAFLPAAGLVAVAFFGTNFVAHGTWQPAYAHRGDGQELVRFEGDFEKDFQRGVVAAPVLAQLQKAGLDPGPAPTVTAGAWPTQKSRRWLINFGQRSQAVVARDFADGGYRVLAWNNWYEFPGSYWLSNNRQKSGVDRGTEDPLVYLFHITIGHHGVLSQTPIWLGSLLGVLLMFGRRSLRLGMLAAGVLSITLVVFAFYVSREAHDRNYGGWTCCFRWAIWMYPLWWVALLVAADRFWRFGWLRAVFSVLLVASIVQAVIPAANPWSRPWLQEVWDSRPSANVNLD